MFACFFTSLSFLANLRYLANFSRLTGYMEIDGICMTTSVLMDIKMQPIQFALLYFILV